MTIVPSMPASENSRAMSGSSAWTGALKDMAMSSVSMGRIGVVDVGGRGRHGNHVGPWARLQIILSGITAFGTSATMRAQPHPLRGCPAGVGGPRTMRMSVHPPRVESMPEAGDVPVRRCANAVWQKFQQFPRISCGRGNGATPPTVVRDQLHQPFDPLRCGRMGTQQ